MKHSSPQDYRPNTRKLYEDFHQVCVLPVFEIHHVLPVRLGGTHDVSNLIPVTRDEHVQAHFDLWVEYGDPRDLCAAYMISGRNKEAHLVACAMGGTASQIKKRATGMLNGFQQFDKKKRIRVASNAGKIGGAAQVLKRLGIHVDDAAQRSAWARMGAEAVKKQFSQPEVQASRGRRGGLKNKGAKWYRDAQGQAQAYTATMQLVEPFDVFLKRTGFAAGGRKGTKGSKFYNNGVKQWMFDAAKHDISFEVFLQNNGFIKGRLK